LTKVVILVRYTMCHHFFWAAFGDIPIATVLLLVQCTKY